MSPELEELIRLADEHGDGTGEPDHTVGDLQDLLRTAFDLLPPVRQRAFFETDAVKALKELTE
jgi:hypothetical protein